MGNKKSKSAPRRSRGALKRPSANGISPGAFMEPLLPGFRALSTACNVPVRTLRTMAKNGLIPFIKVGHRTVLFSPSKVEKALQKRTIREVTR